MEAKQDKDETKLLNIPEGTSIEDLYLRMTALGYSPEDIMSLIENYDESSFRSYVMRYASSDPSFIISGETGDDVTAEASAPVVDSSAAYTKLYPDLYVENPATEFADDDGTIYLTFDDGPSSNTWDILYILKRYDIKATFFFCGGYDSETQELMKAVADAGHTVGIHSISHDYEKIYESVESYLADFYDTYQCVYEATGVKPRYFRFPGGSINNYDRFVYMQIIAEMTRRGFVYFDWNVSGEDAVHGATWSSIYENILTGIKNNTSDRAIVLLHDAADKTNTVYVLEDIIDKLLDDGYHFGQIDDTVRPITFDYVD
ncbi:MAG: polysaccharide deacetylase [Oscillospiraceae bacterium]|nr:polysaccharide deacetylase [Oscillospiraceae bacterium]